ncbi:hypothetical protein HK100_011674 [Physocladia obscura]|uniref:Uncharacterized protein n=1 Tax=Physocladia obscura TaxID=109957 RepID=A0AAD5T8Q5_9FUNG|nr:hypothetical protein HK100_011674 [Physocladia obscura]
MTALARITAVNGTLFIDELGRSRIFRGTNVVVKTPPYVPDTSTASVSLMSFNENDAAVLAQYGVTAIRLGIMWPGVEPTEGNYNQTYLDEMAKIVQFCSDVGIYVLLDFHQDILSERFCGEGVPSYIIDTNSQANSGSEGFPIPLQSTAYSVNADKIPSEANCSSKVWGLYSTADAVGYAYDQLYNNKNNVRDYFIAYWKLVAETFLPFTNILGYDMINEPFFGDVNADPSIASASLANQNNLQPFYDFVSAAIRSVDSNAIIHFESVTLIQEYDYFTKVPGGPDYAKQSTTIGFRVASANALGCGVFLGEFEMGYGTAGSTIPSIQNALDAVDYNLISATGWEYKDYITPGDYIITGTNNGLIDPSTGSVRLDMAAAFSRTYAHTIAGIPTAMCFDNTTSTFALKFQFNGNTGLSGTTELRTNFDVIYPKGFSVNISTSVGGSGGFSTQYSNNSIFIIPSSNGGKNFAKNQSIVSVFVTSNSAATVESRCVQYLITTASSSNAVAGLMPFSSILLGFLLVLHYLLL